MNIIERAVQRWVDKQIDEDETPVEATDWRFKDIDNIPCMKTFIPENDDYAKDHFEVDKIFIVASGFSPGKEAFGGGYSGIITIQISVISTETSARAQRLASLFYSNWKNVVEEEDILIDAEDISEVVTNWETDKHEYSLTFAMNFGVRGFPYTTDSKVEKT